MAKKTPRRQSKKQTLGQTLNGILIGLVLGAIIIAILLWLLNKQKMPTEPPRTAQPEKTEIIVPNEPGTSSPAIQAPASSAVETWPAIDASTVTSSEPMTLPDSGTQPTIKPPADRKVAKDTATKSGSNKVAPKPSPEQILNYGSVEKARAAAKQQAEQKPAAEPASKDQGGRIKLQTGSYATAAQAETQRAKLALLGINTHIETAQVNGKTVHRLRTGNLSRSQANDVRNQLHSNGIDAMVIGAEKQ